MGQSGENFVAKRLAQRIGHCRDNLGLRLPDEQAAGREVAQQDCDKNHQKKLAFENSYFVHPDNCSPDQDEETSIFISVLPTIS